MLEEYLLDTLVEPPKVSQVYIKQSNRIANKQDDDELWEELEKSYTDLHFGKANREFESMAQGLIDKAQQQSIEDEGESSEEEPVDIQKQLAEQMSEEYKLFEIVTAVYPK